MYKLLLSWRYLRTRYIALASIISVTLGVATLIVVNSVMAGFTHEMQARMHGILSDIELSSPGLVGIYDPDWHIDEIRKTIGDDVEGITAIARVPAMLHFEYNGRLFTQHIMLIGIDDETYAEVSDFRQFLLHPENRRRLSFLLRDDGYDPRLKEAGWVYRRKWIRAEQAYLNELRRAEEADTNPLGRPSESADATAQSDEVYFVPLPNQPPTIKPPTIKAATDEDIGGDGPQPVESRSPLAPAALMNRADPFLAGGHVEVFDQTKEQYTGIILGIAIASMKRRDQHTGAMEDVFLSRPGDNVQVTLPSSGIPPKGISGNFTVVDLYECKMHEYDSSFAFVPLRALQELRGMLDPLSGMASVTSIQIKLKPGANLLAVQMKLQQRFPPDKYPYRVQTWQDIQGPLLAAVQLETTILNILLFLIIAVAGFGILATFFMIVVEKTRDIGILKALGAPSRGVMSIFLTYGLSLGIVGSGVGILLGLLFVANINQIADLIESLTGKAVFSEEVYYFSEIPTIIQPLTVALVAIGAMMIAVLASVLPAIRAARLHPVEALRYE